MGSTISWKILNLASFITSFFLFELLFERDVEIISRLTDF